VDKMQIEYWPIEKLVKYDKNPRKNDHAVEKAATLIKEHGFRVPVIIKGEGQVIDGHLRIKAAISLGMREVPCVRADDMSDAQVKAFRLSVNKMAEFADWDADLLQDELLDLRAMGFDLELTGFDQETINDLLPEITPTEGLTDPEDVPDTPETPVSEKGDLWTLGNHRLLCGDSTSLQDVERLMDGRKAAMIFTDPPYNVNYVGKTKKKMTIENDNMSNEGFRAFLRDCFTNMAAVTVPGGAFYVCHADIEAVNFRESLREAGFLLKQSLIWMKNHFILGRQDYHWQHEPILYGWLEGAAHRWYGDRKQPTIIDGRESVIAAPCAGGGGYQLSIFDGEKSIIVRVPSYEVLSAVDNNLRETIWRCPKPLTNDEHPTMKPVALVAKALNNSSGNGDVVLDLFGGSGSTLIACEQNARICCTMEMDRKYCDVIVKRWESFTGKKAERA